MKGHTVTGSSVRESILRKVRNDEGFRYGCLGRLELSLISHDENYERKRMVLRSSCPA